MKALFVLLCTVVNVIVTLAQHTSPSIPIYPQRERHFDLHHIRIEVGFDETKKQVFGKVIGRGTPLDRNFTHIELDAEDIKFLSASVNGQGVSIDTSTKKKVRLVLPKSFSQKDTMTYQIEYVATPKKGLYFVAKDTLTPDSPRQIWTQGESQDNHHWFPCFDSPNEKSTSEIILTVNMEYLAISNGRLIRTTEDKKNKTKTWHWVQDKPHATYLIMLAAGDYVRIEDKYKNKQVDFYAYKSNQSDARNSLNHTVEAIDFFSRKIGYEYPWDKYSQIILRNFMFGGMENTSATTLTETTIHDKRSEIDGVSSVGLMAHELAHQWWGDLLTTKSWSHVWLNESFATYFDALFTEHYSGVNEFQWSMMNNASSAKYYYKTQRKPIVFAEGTNLEDWPVPNVYQKGSCVLNMIRWLLGDELWWKAMNVYAHRYEYQNVETQDLRSVIEEVSGKNFGRFFSEWVYGVGHPGYVVSSEWNSEKHVIDLRVRQVQLRDSLTGLFTIPVDIAVSTSAGKTVHRIEVKLEDETFSIPCVDEPLLVEFDAPGVILKDVEFNKPLSTWIYQLKHGSGVESKYMALDSLQDARGNKDVFLALKDCAMNEPFSVLRRKSIRTLRDFKEMITEEDYLKLVRDANARVRVEAVQLMDNFPGNQTVEMMHHIINSDSSYACIGAAMKVLTRHDSAKSYNTISALLTKQLQPAPIVAAAFTSLLSLKEKQSVPMTFKYIEPAQRTDVRLSAVQLVAKLGKGFPGAVEKLINVLKDRSVMIRSVSARALGEFEDASALPALRNALQTETTHSVKRNLELAIEKLEKKHE